MLMMKAILVFNGRKNWLKTYRAINNLLSYGVNILWSQESVAQEGLEINSGDFLIPLENILEDWNNRGSIQSYTKLTEKSIIKFLHIENVSYEKIEISKSINVFKLKPANVALYQDSGGFNHALGISTSGFDVNWISGMDVAVGALDSYDIFMSGGGGGAKKANINRENLLLASMGVEGAKNITKFVREGGAYFGCCGGSYIASVVRDRFMKWWHPAKKYMTLLNVEDWHINENSDSGFKSPGMGTYVAKNAAPNNPIMFGMPKFFECVHWNGPIWNLIESAVENASSPESLVEFENVSPEKFTPSEYFKTNEIADDLKIKKTGIHKACKRNKTAIAQGYFGTGLVILSGSHPEMKTDFGSKLSKDNIWESAKILSNATFWASTNNRKKKNKIKIKNNITIPLRSQCTKHINKLKRIKEITVILKRNDVKADINFLNKEFYTLSYGLSPEKMYNKILEDLPNLCEIILSEFEKLDDLVIKSMKILNKIKNMLAVTTNNNEINSLDILQERGMFSVFRCFNMLAKQKDPLWNQKGDQVFQGIYDLIDISLEKAEKALKRQQYLSKENNLTSELVDNPFTNIDSARIRLDNALKLLWINQAALEKFIKIWKLYDCNS